MTHLLFAELLKLNRKLHAELCGRHELDRDSFEELIGAMARSGLVRLTDSVFEKDGKQIPFRKASLTRDAEYLDENTPIELSIRESAVVTEKKGRHKKAVAAAKKLPKQTHANAETIPAEQVPSAEPMLKDWRRALAKKLGVPAFRIMSDRVLLAIAENEPRTAAELLAIPGIGIKTVEKHGSQIYRILNEARFR
jgi:DNA topoisomerase-3